MTIFATHPSRPRPFIVAVGAIAAWSAIAWAQVAPEGAHHTSVGPGAGLTSPSSPTGGFAASIPLDLPDPRGPLPVPVSIVYTGSARAGAAGAGWDVPLTYVRRQTSTWRRRPSYFDTSGNAPERIQLVMNGAPQLMVPNGNVYVPFASGQYMELSPNGAGWRARTLDNLEYVFTPRGNDPDPELWLLTEIRDLVGTDKVTLRYAPSGLDLVNVAYTFGHDGKTPLYEIDLVHQPFNGMAFESIREDETRIIRTTHLSRIEVRARDNHYPASEPKIIRAYHFAYEPDPDTTKPRLKDVTVTGEEGTFGDPLPVASYTYGSLTPNSTADIHIGPAQIIARNLGTTSYGDDLASTFNLVQELEEELPPATPPPSPHWEPDRARRETSYARHLLRDFTGDGLPDLVYKEGSAWRLVPNRLDAAGEPRLDGAAMSWDASSGPAELHVETTFRFVPPTTTTDDDPLTGEDEALAARKAMITTETWTTFVDWNGDGRLDVVDTTGGQDPFDNDRDYWRVWLNHAAADGTIFWREAHISIAQVRAYLESKGFTPLDESERFPSVSWPQHLPLARSRSWPRVNTWSCVAWQCTGPTGNQPGTCTQVEACTPPPPWPEPDDPVQVDTMNEWSLVDQNGDSAPDIVALTMPVRQCERGFDHWQGAHDRWTTAGCAVGSSPDQCLGIDLLDGNYSYAKEHHEKITAAIPVGGHWQGKCGDGPMPEAGIAVFLNRQGPWVGLGNMPFAAPFETTDSAPTGVAHWTTGAKSLHEDYPELSEGVSWHAAALLDSFSTGELTHRLRPTISDEEDTAIFQTNRHEQCETGGSSSATFVSFQTAGEADLNGDGLADHVYTNVAPGPTQIVPWYVRFNTGVGYGPPRRIQAGNLFALSEAQGLCDGQAQTTGGLTDLDGDGIPELLKVDNGNLVRYELLTSPLEVGRLTEIRNGYGATTYVRYANAKADQFTRHDVPFPEIVVSETGTRLDDGSVAVAPVFYAYGTAKLDFEPLAGQWSFSGYRRVVAMTGKIASIGPTATVQGIAVIADRGSPAVPGSAWDEHVTAQQVTRTRFIETDLAPSAINSLLVGDPLAFAETTLKHAGHQIVPSVGGLPNTDCADLDPVLGVPVGTSRCGSAGVVFNRSSAAWEGLAAPPSMSNTLASSSIDEVDAYGRPTRTSNAGDRRRTDDDVCTTVTYASPPGGGPFPSVPSAMALTDCGWGNPVGGRPGPPKLLSIVRFYYDDQPHGVVARGRLTSRQVDRYGPGGYLDTYTVDRKTYDSLGEVATVTRERALGSAATHVVEVTRDAFGATVTSTRETASDVGEVFTGYLKISSWPSRPSVATDHAGVQVVTEHDGFGRSVLSWVDTGTQRSVRTRTIYEDTAPRRRVTTETFPGNTPLGTEVMTTDKQRTTVELDALGRARFTLTDLGVDYGGARMVSDLVEYDELGRVTFAAAPFSTSDDPFEPDPLAEPFGTSTIYDRRGRVVREVSTYGYVPEVIETSVQGHVFVNTHRYYYENGQALTASSGADENDPSSDNYLALDAASHTALGRPLRRARFAPGGARVDLVDQEWDRLGRLTKLRRYLDPALAAGAVTWTSTYDSLGRRLSMSEPGMSTRHSEYDEDGNEIASWWLDGSTRRMSRARYDGFGRVVTRQLSTISTSGTEQVESLDRFHYDVHSGRPDQPTSDLRGRLSWVETTGVGSVFYGYDALGRASSTSYLYQGHGGLVRESTVQTLGGRTESIRLETQHTDDIIHYAYDSAERMRRVNREGGTLLADAEIVDERGRYRRVVYGNGRSEGFDYSSFGREDLISWNAPGHVFEYLERDAAGRLLYERDTTPTQDLSFLYEHDVLGRLTAVAKSDGGLPGVEVYTHDPLGNLLSRTTTTGVPDLVYRRDPADPDRTCRVGAPGSGTTCNFRYDGAGNVDRDDSGPGRRRFFYDSGQRITLITRGFDSVRLRHGPVGRAHTDVRTPAGGRQAWHFGLVEERWLPDGLTHIERRIPGPLGTTVSLRTEIVNGGTPTHTTVYAHGDGRGNRVFTGDGGAIVQSATYGTFGQTSATASGTSVTQTDDLWNGGDNFPEVGVVMLGPRAYDPELGRFLQRDPLAVVLRASTASPYSFAYSNPVDFADPSGLISLNIWRNVGVWGPGPSGGGGSSGVGPGTLATALAVGVAGAFASTFSAGSPLDPLTAVGAAGYSANAIGLLQYIRNQQTPCGTVCGLGRTAASLPGHYADYTLGKAEGLAEGVWDLGKEAAIRGAKGPVWVAVEAISQIPDQVRTGQAVVDAVRNDPWGTAVSAACGMDGCSFGDLGYAEGRVAAMFVAPASGAHAVAGMAKLAASLRLAAASRLNTLSRALAVSIHGVGAPPPFSVGPYRPSASPFENHHGVLDVWASHNVPGYVSRGANTPSIVLTQGQHAATKAVYRDWLFERTGRRVGGSIDWKNVSARDIQTLANRMFDAAGVPAAARTEYFRAFHQHIYGIGQ